MAQSIRLQPQGQYGKKRASVAGEPCIRTAFDYLGIGRGHVPARTGVCAGSSPEAEQRAGHVA